MISGIYWNIIFFWPMKIGKDEDWRYLPWKKKPIFEAYVRGCPLHFRILEFPLKKRQLNTAQF